MNIPRCERCGISAAFPLAVTVPYTCLSCLNPAQPENSDAAGAKGGSLERVVRRRACETYVLEKVEAYNIAIEALRGHEPADGDPTGIARNLRHALADKLDREIQKWMDAQPSND